MTDDDTNAKGFTLRRWSQRKLAAARAVQPPEPVGAPMTAAPEAVAIASAPPPVPADEAPLPPVESLGADSDFTGFFKPKVGEALKRQALKQLLRDPRFNVMDGLDIYIDDYSQPDPIEPELVRQMVQGRYIFDPPRTRVNDAGVVEDVPRDEPVPAIEDAETLPTPAATEDLLPTGELDDADALAARALVASNPADASPR